MELDVKLDGIFHPVALVRNGEGTNIRIDDCDLPVALEQIGDTEHKLTLNGKEERVHLAYAEGKVFMHALGRDWELTLVDPVEHASGHDEDDQNVVQAPMPGVVVQLTVAAGDTVTKGQSLLTIESMKLETVIEAWRDGVVAEVSVALGDSFDKGAALVSLEEEE